MGMRHIMNAKHHIENSKPQLGCKHLKKEVCVKPRTKVQYEIDQLSKFLLQYLEITDIVH